MNTTAEQWHLTEADKYGIGFGVPAIVIGITLLTWSCVRRFPHIRATAQRLLRKFQEPPAIPTRLSARRIDTTIQISHNPTHVLGAAEALRQARVAALQAELSVGRPENQKILKFARVQHSF